jgi:DNA-binding NarL/FixJ family response regulator
MKILLIEDNFAFGEPLREDIERNFGEVQWLETESDFYAEWPDIAAAPPRAAVIDVMLKWDILRRDKRVRPPYAANMYHGGIRCAQKLSEDPRTKDVPIILFSVIDRADLAEAIQRMPGNVTYLQKSAEPNHLILRLREVTSINTR